MVDTMAPLLTFAKVLSDFVDAYDVLREVEEECSLLLMQFVYVH